MPQNWWEMYPEIVPLGRSFGPSGGRTYRPNPAARPRPMPMLGDAMSGPAMGLQAGQPYSAFGPDPFSSGRFGPSDFTGGQPGIGQIQSRIPDQAGRFGYPEAPQVSDPNGPPLDRRAAVQQAAAAIRGGADPRAVRARLSQVGNDISDFGPSDPFSDLIPGGRQVQGAMNPSGAADQPLSGGDFVSRLYDLDDGAGAGAGDGGAPDLDRAAAIQHAADAIQRGADPDAVHARLIQMGQGDQEPPSPFSDLMPGGRPGTIGDSAPPPVPAQPAFDDRGGLARRAAAPGFAQDRLGNLTQRLDPRLAPQKVGGFQKSAQQKVGAGGSGPATFSKSAAASNPRVAPPAPWRSGGAMSPQQVEARADLGLRMYKIHRALGMPPEQAAGWAANAVAESQGDYRHPQNGGGPGYGLFQWGDPRPAMDRRRVFQQVFGHPIQQSSEREQLQFRDWELAHSYARLAKQIAGASSAGDVAAAITRRYEGPADWRHAMLDRANIAEAIMRRARQMPDVVNPNGAPGDPWQRGIVASGSGPVR